MKNKDEMEGQVIIGKHDPFPKWLYDTLEDEVDWMTNLLALLNSFEIKVYYKHKIFYNKGWFRNWLRRLKKWATT